MATYAAAVTTIILARKHLGCGNEASARQCLADAVRLKDEWLHVYAYSRALQSLVHSVGMYHRDYEAAKNLR